MSCLLLISIHLIFRISKHRFCRDRVGIGRGKQTFDVRRHHPPRDPTPLQKRHSRHTSAVKVRLNMTFPISGTYRHVPVAIRIHDEDCRSGHLGPDAESDPLVRAWCLQGEIDCPR
jgi:hypothetical protein